MSFIDYRADPSSGRFKDSQAAEGGDSGSAGRERWVTVKLEETYADRELDAAFRRVSAPDFKARCLPTCHVSREVREENSSSEVLKRVGEGWL